MDLLGPSVQTLLHEANYRCPLETGLNIMLQMLEILQKTHAQGIVYRDMKPENWCAGLNGNSNKIYLIDFGLAKPFMVKTKDEKGCSRMEHIPWA